ncbi:hypothetical protein [Maricaulis maris]|uniref:hypothetical protein n=1 Tax=Maricaulis maris TaxID=74318 RepID=UPI003B8B3A08
MNALIVALLLQAQPAAPLDLDRGLAAIRLASMTAPACEGEIASGRLAGEHCTRFRHAYAEYIDEELAVLVLVRDRLAEGEDTEEALDAFFSEDPLGRRVAQWMDDVQPYKPRAEQAWSMWELATDEG